jgi:hypothetical protein
VRRGYAPHGHSLARGSSRAPVADGSASVRALWLGRCQIAGIRPGRNIAAHGRMTVIRGERTIYNRRYELRATDQGWLTRAG